MKELDLPGGQAETDAERIARLGGLVLYYENKYGEAHFAAPVGAP